jgi:phosphoglycolate phosphatase-like HAD superfamily hydrolase
MIRAVIFDFDGVLVESVDTKTEAYASLFAGEGEDVVRKVVAYHLEHGGVSRFEKFKFIYQEILHRPLSGKKFVTLCRDFSRRVVDEVVNARWVDGAREFLEKKKDTYQFFIVSGTPDEELKAIIERRGMESLFVAVYGSPRTKDVLLNELMTFYGLKCNELVFVGDAATDLQAAKSTGIRFIWRRVSSDTPPMINFEGPMVSNLTQLEDCLEKVVS